MAVLTKLRGNARTASIPVLMVSATNDPAVRDQALAAGADAFLTKPVDLELLVDALEAALGRPLGGG